MRVLLDSNAYSQLMRGREQVTRIVRGAEEVLLSAVCAGGAHVRVPPRLALRAQRPGDAHGLGMIGFRNRVPSGQPIHSSRLSAGNQLLGVRSSVSSHR